MRFFVHIDDYGNAFCLNDFMRMKFGSPMLILLFNFSGLFLGFRKFVYVILEMASCLDEFAEMRWFMF